MRCGTRARKQCDRVPKWKMLGRDGQGEDNPSMLAPAEMAITSQGRVNARGEGRVSTRGEGRVNALILKKVKRTSRLNYTKTALN